MNGIQAGSTVRHNPTGETWFVLGVNKNKNKVCAAGWPPSIAKLSDCKLIEIGEGISEEELVYRDKQFGYSWESNT